MEQTIPPAAGTAATGDIDDLIFSELDYEVSKR